MRLLDEMADAYGEAYQLEFRALVENLHPVASRFLEWGSGVTTGILCDVARLRPDPFVLSIDHNPVYQKQVAKELPKYPFLHLRTLDLQGPSYSQTDNGPSYSSYPLYIKATFDVVFIDGRRRMECAFAAAQCLNEGGLVILHDWRRDRYQSIRTLYDVVSEEGEFLTLRLKPGLKQPRLEEEPSQRLGLIVPVRGYRAERELQISQPFFERYASTIGADFHIVGRDSSLPPHRLKSAALEVADRFDRIIVADCDMIVRDGTPSLFDIVPPGAMGVFFEGEVFPRQQACDELKDIYGLEEDIPSRSYFNSGLMVLSRAHYQMLQALQTGRIFGHPQYEQGFLNVQRVELKIPTFPLGVDLNYIPDDEFLVNDWRFGFIVHFAGSGKEPFKQEMIWQDIEGDGATFARRKIISADVRDTLMRRAEQEIMGKAVFFADPTDFLYKPGHAYLYSSSHSQAIGRVEAHEGHPPTLAVFGAKLPLVEGEYAARFITREEKTLIVADAKFDVMLNGVQVIADGFWPKDGIIRFQLSEYTPLVEVRLYCATSPYEFVRLEIVPIRQTLFSDLNESKN